MKALSIKQPFASLILEGKKAIETRTWKTDYRGPLLICAGKTLHQGFVFDGDYKAAPQYSISAGYQLGVMLCVVDLIGCQPMHVADSKEACCSWHPDLWAWKLESIRPVQPSAIRGQLRLFEVPDQTISYLHMGQ